MKRISSRPKAAKSTSQPLPDREVLLLGILALWRNNAMFHLKNIKNPEIEEWVTIANKIWEAPVDTSVKVSHANGFHNWAEAVHASTSNDTSDPDPFFDIKVTFLKLTLCVPTHHFWLTRLSS